MKFYKTDMDMDLTEWQDEKDREMDLIFQLKAEYIDPRSRNVSYVIKGCPLLVSLNTNLLVDLHPEVGKCSIISFALERGTNLLRTLPGIDDIQKCRGLFYQYAPSEDRSALRGWFTNKDFIISGEVQKSMGIYVNETALLNNHQLASSVGMTYRASMILAIFGALIEASEVPYQDRLEMVETLKRFKTWIEQ